MVKNYHFSGWATKPNLLCTDGRTIMSDAFKHHDGKKVPLVWNHQHNSPENVLGSAYLEHRDGGLYVYGVFNDTETGRNAKSLIEHGDVVSLSIYANGLKQNGGLVKHGNIREVSLVLAGANPAAFIDDVVRHDDSDFGESVIYSGEKVELPEAIIEHSDQIPNEQIIDGGNPMEPIIQHADNKSKTIADVFETLNEEQKTMVYALVGSALEEGEDDDMKQNVFDTDGYMTGRDDTPQISHSQMVDILTDAKRYGSMKESFLQHGITDVEYLFPDAKNITNTPIWITRKMEWVSKVMGGVHRTPFSRIKSLFADITEDDARAKGYVKGNMKKEQLFSLLKRTTDPTTVYKKQKMHRDDVIDITDFDVIAWLKGEMRMMLEEELGRAILVGDGRLASSEDKIDPTKIRPIWTDDDLFTIKVQVPVPANTVAEDKAKMLIKAAIKARKDYKGSGNPIAFMTEDILTDMLLIEDGFGRAIYDSVEKLATKLRVREIVTVPVMEGLTRVVDTVTHTLEMLIVNPVDYNVGADKGGAINLFDDFDIDYNAQKYLIETRISGALVMPYSAMAIESVVATVETPAEG